MTVAVGTPEPGSLPAQLEAARERARLVFQLKFVATWSR